MEIFSRMHYFHAFVIYVLIYNMRLRFMLTEYNWKYCDMTAESRNGGAGAVGD
jgi:hypothetical protein